MRRFAVSTVISVDYVDKHVAGKDAVLSTAIILVGLLLFVLESGCRVAECLIERLST